MPEKEGSLRSQGGAGACASQNYGRLKSMSADELLLEFEAKMDEMTDLNYDGELIDAYLAALDEKAPLDSDLDADTSWSEFQMKHADLFGKDVTDANGSATESPRRIRPRGLISKIAVIAAVVTLFSVLCVQAAGFNLLGVFGKWTEEVFGFLSSDGGINKSSASESTDFNSEVYLSMKAMLETHGITEDLAPTWYPEGFEVEPPDVQSSKMWDVISYYFSGENDEHFVVKITHHSDPPEMDGSFYEKDDASVEDYVSGGRIFYIFSNLESAAATWSDGEALTISIFGNISVDALKSMIDSIGG